MKSLFLVLLFALPAYSESGENTQTAKPVPHKRTVEHELYTGIGVATYTENHPIFQSENSPATAAHSSTSATVFKLEYAYRNQRHGFAVEGFYMLGETTTQSSDPSVTYLENEESHAYGLAVGPFYHFTTLATRAGVSAIALHRSTVNATAKGELTTYGAVLDLRWRLNSPVYLDSKLAYLNEFQGLMWQIGLDLRFR